MLKKYNIAYVPENKTKEFIDFAEKFHLIADSYLLGINSLPHVTVCQFYEDDKKINLLWSKVCASINNKVLDLLFEEISFITFNEKIFWVSLLPNNFKKLQDIHKVICNIIQQKENEAYDPHLTLLNTQYGDISTKVNKKIFEYKNIFDTFKLVLGECDMVGQLNKIIA